LDEESDMPASILLLLGIAALLDHNFWLGIFLLVIAVFRHVTS